MGNMTGDGIHASGAEATGEASEEATSGCDCKEDAGAFYVFDEQGNLVDTGAPAPPLPVPSFGPMLPVPPPVLSPPFPPPITARACPITTLDGSWLVEFAPQGGPASPVFPLTHIRGPMRIEVGAASLRISGDIYARRMPFAPNGPVAPGPPRAMPWYPQLPMTQYVWYFRSTGCTYAAGQLQFTFERRLWDRAARAFTTTDAGQMTLTCRRPLGLSTRIARLRRMNGTARIGGRTYHVTATKTSTMYRGCAVEVDAMTNRRWPATAAMCSGAVIDFRSVYATAGWEVQVTVDDTALPEDPQLSVPELQTLIAGHETPATDPSQWRMWLLVGSAQGTLFGLMFDDDAAPREGAVGFADPQFGNDPTIAPFARNQPLGAVPLAFLRTLVHEAGHALNLFHPKHDVHAPPIGTSIMNQTGDVMGFATTAN